MSQAMLVQAQIFSPQRRSEAQYLYDGMRARGWFRRVRALLRRRSRQLLALSDLVAPDVIVNRYDAGIQIVPISQICGSENRTDDFDADFRPLSDRTASRWQSIAEAWLQDVSLPPVELILVGNSYFVRDGHHRISVACTLGQTHIDAVVTVWKVAQSLCTEMNN